MRNEDVIKVAILDDHPILVQGLATLIERENSFLVSGAYTSPAQFWEEVPDKIPDVLILDIQMPESGGDEVLPLLKKRYPFVKVLVFTNFESALYAHNMLKLGADGFILKTTSEDKLVKAVKTVYGGGKYFGEALELQMDNLAKKFRQAVSSRNSLRPREKEVLQLLANGYTGNEIAKMLFLSAGTIENYRNSLLIKLEAKNTAVLIKRALQLGLVDF